MPTKSNTRRKTSSGQVFAVQQTTVNLSGRDQIMFVLGFSPLFFLFCIFSCKGTERDRRDGILWSHPTNGYTPREKSRYNNDDMWGLFRSNLFSRRHDPHYCSFELFFDTQKSSTFFLHRRERVHVQGGYSTDICIYRLISVGLLNSLIDRFLHCSYRERERGEWESYWTFNMNLNKKQTYFRIA